MLCRSMPRKKAWPLGVILCPTRELAHQLAGQASHFVAGSQLTVKCATGGASLTQQVCAAVSEWVSKIAAAPFGCYA